MSPDRWEKKFTKFVISTVSSRRFLEEIVYHMCSGEKYNNYQYSVGHCFIFCLGASSLTTIVFVSWVSTQ